MRRNADFLCARGCNMPRHRRRPGLLYASAIKTSLSVIVVLALAASLQGCPPNPSLHPSITFTRQDNVLIIGGSGFANVPLCAQLSLLGDATGQRTIGTPSCSGGSFVDFAYPYSYAGCVNPGSTTSVTIFATDTQGSNAGASLTVQIPWDTYCSLQAADCNGSGAACQACGGEREPACNGACVQPAADGQRVCSTAACPSCSAGTCPPAVCSFQRQTIGGCSNTYPDLHPTLSNPNDPNSQLICTANCGHTQGYHPCYPYMDGCNAGAGVTFPNTLVAPQGACITASTFGLSLYTCYNNSQISTSGSAGFSSCLCVPSNGTCPVNQSSGNGVCAPTNHC
jgi:hypothetical protein